MPTCRYCDSELEHEWPMVQNSELICINPDCKESPRFVPFLRIPNEPHFRGVNDNNDVAIRLEQTDHTYTDLVIVREADDKKHHYGWFIHACHYDEEGQVPEDGPRYFRSLDIAIEDAIKYIENGKESAWISKIQLIRNFAKIQE